MVTGTNCCRTWFLWCNSKGPPKGRWASPLSQRDQLFAHVAEGEGTASCRVCDPFFSSTSQHRRILPPRALEDHPRLTSIHGILRQWRSWARHQGLTAQKSICGRRIRMEHVLSAGYCSFQMSLWCGSSGGWEQYYGLGELCETTPASRQCYDPSSRLEAGKW
jgi:hypothetical protein